MTDTRLYTNGGGKLHVRRKRDATLPTTATCCECGGRVYARNRKAQKVIDERAGRVDVRCSGCGG